MKRLLVIGIGSLIMTDDGIGTRVAEALKDKMRGHDVRILTGETDCLHCLNEIRPDDFLVIIDAAVRGKEPGSIETLPISAAFYNRMKIRTQHDFSLIDAILLNYPDIRGYLIGIEAAEIGFGFGLSLPIKLKFDIICENIFNIIAKIEETMKRA